MKALFRGKKLVAVVALLVLLAGGGGAFAVLAPAGAEGKGPAPTVEVGLGEPFIVNLRDPGRFARAEIVLEVGEHALAAGGGHGSEGATLIEHAAARDAVIATVGRYSYARLLSPAGRNRLRAQLRRAVAKAIGTNVAGVLFVDFAVQ